MIVNKLNLKKIWMLLFFDIIFAEENLQLQIRSQISVLKNQISLAIHKNKK